MNGKRLAVLAASAIALAVALLAPVPSVLADTSQIRTPVRGEFALMRLLASDRVRDSAAATGTKQSLRPLCFHRALAAVLLNPNERDVD
jgi:hypothetical protein